MPSTLNVDVAISRLAAKTCSAVHARSLREEGIDRSSVSRRIADGRLARPLPLTYFVGPHAHDPTFEMRCMAGVLHAGDDAAVCRHAAAVLLGCWNRPMDAVPIDIASPTRTRTKATDYVFHALRDVDPFAHVMVGDIPVLGPAELCLDLARVMTPLQLAFVLNGLRYLRLLEFEDVGGLLMTSRHVPGAVKLRAALGLVRVGSAGSRGATEDELHRRLEAAGVAPDLVNVRGAMGNPADEPDFVWTVDRLNVEIDGDQHATPEQAAVDRDRDLEASRDGWRVLRVPWRSVWGEPQVVVTSVREFLGR